MRILLDTNIVVSGLLGHDGPPGQLLGLWANGHFTLVTSNYQIDELRRVLGYKHLRTRISGSKAIAFLENIDKRAIILETLLEVDLSPDPDDNPILATAITGKVELVVSGDKGHMIALGNANGIPIVTAREALARLRVDA